MKLFQQSVVGLHLLSLFTIYFLLLVDFTDCHPQFQSPPPHHRHRQSQSIYDRQHGGYRPLGYAPLRHRVRVRRRPPLQNKIYFPPSPEYEENWPTDQEIDKIKYSALVTGLLKTLGDEFTDSLPALVDSYLQNTTLVPQDSGPNLVNGVEPNQPEQQEIVQSFPLSPPPPLPPPPNPEEEEENTVAPIENNNNNEGQNQTFEPPPPPEPENNLNEDQNPNNNFEPLPDLPRENENDYVNVNIHEDGDGQSLDTTREEDGQWEEVGQLDGTQEIINRPSWLAPDFDDVDNSIQVDGSDSAPATTTKNVNLMIYTVTSLWTLFWLQKNIFCDLLTNEGMQ